MRDDMLCDAVDIDSKELGYIGEEEYLRSWVFFDLLDKNNKMIVDPNPGFYNFLIRAYRRTFYDHRLITYNSVVDNSSAYYSFLKYCGVDDFTEKEKQVLRLRFGFGDVRRKNIEEIEKELNMSSMQVESIVRKVFRNAERTISKNGFMPLFWYNQENNERNGTAEGTRSTHIESMIKDEISSYLSDKCIDVDNLFSGAIIKSPRFRGSFTKQFVGEMDISTSEIDMSVRTYNILNRAGISKLSDILALDDNMMANIRNLGPKTREEVLNIQERYRLKLQHEAEEVDCFDVPIRMLMFLRNLGVNTYGDLANMSLAKLVRVIRAGQCSADKLIEQVDKWERKRIVSYQLESNIFEIPGEMPITRTILPVSDMVKLLQKGLFYVSDVFNYYSLITGNHAYISEDVEIVGKLLRAYSAPVIRIAISAGVFIEMFDKGITTIEQIENCRDTFDNEYKDEIDLILSEYNKAYSIVNKNAIQ